MAACRQNSVYWFNSLPSWYGTIFPAPPTSSPLSAPQSKGGRWRQDDVGREAPRGNGQGAQRLRYALTLISSSMRSRSRKSGPDRPPGSREIARQSRLRMLTFRLFACALLCFSVGNIPYDVTEDQLKEIFSEAGSVVNFRCESLFSRLQTRFPGHLKAQHGLTVAFCMMQAGDGQRDGQAQGLRLLRVCGRRHGAQRHAQPQRLRDQRPQPSRGLC